MAASATSAPITTRPSLLTGLGSCAPWLQGMLCPEKADPLHSGEGAAVDVADLSHKEMKRVGSDPMSVGANGTANGAGNDTWNSPVLVDSVGNTLASPSVSSLEQHKELWRMKSLRGLFSVKENSPVNNMTEREAGKEQAVTVAVREDIVDTAMDTLRSNSLGSYTVPTKGLYPFQWNWDSAIVAAGWAVFDEERAWLELDSLMSGQWEDGMVPSIIFHRPSDSYFPGPEIWGTKENPSRSTGITQPPVAAMSARFLYEHAERKPLAEAMIRKLFPKLLAWHRWWYKARDPEGTGLVAILHPWESGMDNSPSWDDVMQFPIIDIPPYVRRDLTHVDAAMRPTKETYDRYLTLLYTFKAANFYDMKQLYYVSPFRVTDLCVNCILFRANRDLLWLARQLGEEEVVKEVERWLRKGEKRFSELWDEKDAIFKCKDQITGALCNASTSAGFLPLFAGMATQEQADKLVQTLSTWLEDVRYGVPSIDPTDPRFEPLRYWRGPVWLIINWMISNGLKHYGYFDLAERIKQNSAELTTISSLAEYFDPITGAGAGGSSFSWTAAMCLAWIDRPAAIAIGHKMTHGNSKEDFADLVS